ncbi:1966_t:CDS:2 [Funneliformis mosseae]|uniref:1966_t:CDS:1 n=1 Tax=Funneliformis mosseae TaxID=27381 RepID=A0A9N9CR52_FUNMO|nr:1966_t:CDS:2 [Funneliformis mosseae]
MTNVPGPQRPKIDGGFKEGDLLKEMNKVPLFMTEMPEEESDTLAALQTLIYDGPPEEIAENFKNQGNECFKVGKSQYNDALEYYTKALDIKCKDDKIIEACLTNRAAVNLELENYRKVLADCSKALKLNPQNIKAYYRSAKALYALDKIEEAIDCCEHGLAVQPNNKVLQNEKVKCLNRKEILEKKRREKEERERKERESKEELARAIEGRNIKMVNTSKTQALQKNVRLDKETNNLIWPVVFSYPEYKESDFIESFNEVETFLDHLKVMFEQHASWDNEKKYTPYNIAIYFEYHLPIIGNGLPTTKLFKIGKKCTLKATLSHPKYVVKDGIPNFIILSEKGKFAEEFVAKYK